MTVKEEPLLPMTVSTVPVKLEPPSIINDALHSKYLHKKFKKMASPLLTDDCNTINGNHLVMTSPEASPGGRYVCSYCNLACAKPSVLQKHIRAHTNERPYPCGPCGFAFKTKSNLYKHCRSRTHASKLEETGEKIPVFDGDEIMSSDEEDSSSNFSTSANFRMDVDSVSKEEVPKTIYKPKYRFMETPTKVKKPEDRKENAHSPTPRLQLKIPVPNTTPSVTTTSPFTSGSSPSPEFLHHHINKLISENQAIVETNDPFWSKKFLHRTNSSENSSSSPLSTSPSTGDSPLIKKTARQFAPVDYADDINCNKSSSKLAFALLRPQASISTSPAHEACDVQPLNLSTSNKDLCGPQQNRKRSYSEGFPERSPKQLKDRATAVFNRFNSTHSDSRLVVDISNELSGNPHHLEGSIIKDLLLKAKINGPVSADVINSNRLLTLTPSVSDERAFSPSSQFMCHLCKHPEGFGNLDNLEIHQVYHCRASDKSLRISLQTPSPQREVIGTTSPSHRLTQGTLLITPSHPSPGPLLGSTPLVDSYCTKSPHTSEFTSLVLKKKRYDAVSPEVPRVVSATTLRSLEELSKCPMRSNLQMFGGEVKILDSPRGESTTLRIDPTNTKSPSKSSSELSIQISGPSKEGNNLKESTQNMVTNIAKQGLNSGGSILEISHKVKGSEQQSFHQLPFENGLLPSVSKMVPPNIPGTARDISRVEHQLKSYNSILTDSTVINPLTSITAYNPLTLPPAPHLLPNSPAATSSAGIITIFHGGKEIPYVPGMPGPHTLLHNPVPIFTSTLESDANQTKLSDNLSCNPVESTVRRVKPENCQSVINKPSSLNIPAIQLNSPIDSGNVSLNIRKRTVDENQSSPSKRSQGVS